MDIYFKKVEKEEYRRTFVVENPLARKRIRLATSADYPSILEIYRPYVEETTVTFEYEVPTLTEFEQRLSTIAQTYPVLVLEVGDEIVGYAYASVFKPRSAYQWSAETVIYLQKQKTNRGFGRPLYLALIEALKLQGICQGVAVITAENESSIVFHSRLGFVSSARLLKSGFKFGKWLDVEWMQLPFVDFPENPEPVRPITEVAGTAAFKQLMDAVNEQINY